jgi:hypothetical protein
MSRDIATVAAETNRATQGADLTDALLTALVATPAGRSVAWRRFYRGVRTLVAGFTPASGEKRRELDPAFIRLRQFVRENIDLADTPLQVISSLSRDRHYRGDGAFSVAPR